MEEERLNVSDWSQPYKIFLGVVGLGWFILASYIALSDLKEIIRLLQIIASK